MLQWFRTRDCSAFFELFGVEPCINYYVISVEVVEWQGKICKSGVGHVLTLEVLRDQLSSKAIMLV